MTKAVREDPASYMDKFQYDEVNERMRYAQEAKRARTTSPSSQVKKTKKNPPARLLLRNAILLDPNKPSMRAAAKNIKQSVQGAGQSAGSILKMIRKLPSKVVQQIYKGLEKMEPDEMTMIGTRLQKKYPGE
jgi:hypothetical protein